MLLCVLLCFAASHELSALQGFSGSVSHSGLEEKALMIADSLVKRQDLNNSTAGAAFFDPGKKRVFENLVSLGLLYNARPECFGDYCVVELSAKAAGFESLFFSESTEGFKECLGVSRFAMFEESSQKAVLGVVVCAR